MAGQDADDVKPARKLGRGLSEVSHLFLSGAEKRKGAAQGPPIAPDESPAVSESAEVPGLWLPKAAYLSITSGEGTRGKTFLAASLGYGLFARGCKVALVNADAERPDVLDITGSSPTSRVGSAAGRNMGAVVTTNESYGSVVAVDILAATERGLMEPGPGDSPGIAVFPAAEIASPPGASTLPISSLAVIEAAAREAQWVVIDTSPWGEPSRAIWGIATLVMVVTEPGSDKLKASYVAIKRIHSAAPNARIGLVINLVRSYAEGEDCFRKLMEVCRKFLKINLRNYGYVLDDAMVNEAYEREVPLLRAFPDSKAGKGIDWILGLIVMDESAIAKRRREVTFERCALKKGRLQALRS
ncbi:MAG: hypothetical protein V1694_09425 [Candidatus Eisenbacteria bacterium]